MRKLIIAWLIAAPLFGQTTKTRQIVLKCVAASRPSASGESVIYKDCDDGKTYISKDGGAFAEIATAAPTVQPKNGAKAWQLSGGTQVVSSATWTPLTFASESWDFGGYHSTSSNTSRFTVPSGKAGLTIFECGMEASASSGSLTWLRITKNGSSTLKAMNMPLSSDVAAEISTIDDLAVGDYLEVEMYATSASATTKPNDTYCSMVLLGQ